MDYSLPSHEKRRVKVWLARLHGLRPAHNDILFHTAVHIMFVKERQHWINCSVKLDSTTAAGMVLYYRLSPSVELQIMQLYQQVETDAGLVVTVVPLQQQRGTNNCGLSSIAAAVHVANGEDVGTITFDESRMHSHLISCLETGSVNIVMMIELSCSGYSLLSHLY